MGAAATAKPKNRTTTLIKRGVGLLVISLLLNWLVAVGLLVRGADEDTGLESQGIFTRTADGSIAERGPRPVPLSFNVIDHVRVRRLYKEISLSTQGVSWSRPTPAKLDIASAETILHTLISDHPSASAYLAETTHFQFNQQETPGRQLQWLSLWHDDRNWPYAANDTATRSGWPLLSFRTSRFTPERPELDITSSMGELFRIPRSWLPKWGDHPSPDPIPIPIRPIWSGLAINTLFYAASVWVLTAGFSAARRGLRRRSDVCPRCGYSRAGLASGAVCPECGKGAKS